MLLATAEDDREAYGEQRRQSLRLFYGVLVFLVWVDRPLAAPYRIAVRKAKRHEARLTSGGGVQGGPGRIAPRAGRLGNHARTPLTVRYSPEVVAYFKATGKGRRARMDETLKEWIAQRSRRRCGNLVFCDPAPMAVTSWVSVATSERQKTRPDPCPLLLHSFKSLQPLGMSVSPKEGDLIIF